MDERLETWHKTSPTGNFADRIWSTRGDDPSVSPFDPSIDEFRWFDPATGLLSFWGTGMYLKDVVAEAQQLIATCQQAQRSPGEDEAIELMSEFVKVAEVNKLRTEHAIAELRAASSVTAHDAQRLELLTDELQRIEDDLSRNQSTLNKILGLEKWW